MQPGCKTDTLFLQAVIMTRKETIIATILLIVFGTGMHFVHHVPFFNRFLGYIFPVTESVMAHMKMVFYPMLLLSIYLMVSRRDIRELGAPILSGFAVMPLIIAVFFSYWIFVHHEVMFIDVIIYLAAMIGAILLARRLRGNSIIRKWWPLWIAVSTVFMVMAGYLTYNPPDNILFADLG